MLGALQTLPLTKHSDKHRENAAAESHLRKKSDFNGLIRA